jgi:hypothetical protein
MRQFVRTFLRAYAEYQAAIASVVVEAAKAIKHLPADDE